MECSAQATGYPPACVIFAVRILGRVLKLRRLWPAVALVVITASMAACETADTRESGLVGTSLMAGKPAQASIQIYTRASIVPGGGADHDGTPYSRLVGSLKSDRLGKFRVALPAGDYVISAVAVSNSGRSATPSYATVRTHAYTQVELSF